MQDRSRVIFGNDLGEAQYKKAMKTKAKSAKKFGDDSQVSYPVHLEKNAYIGDSLGVQNVLIGDLKQNAHFDLKKHPDGTLPEILIVTAILIK